MDQDLVFLEDPSQLVRPRFDVAIHLSGNVAPDHLGSKINRASVMAAAACAFESMGYHVRLMERQFPPTGAWDPADLYASVVDSIDSADLVVAVHAYPSRGVGVECQIACSLSVPTLVCYHAESYERRTPVVDAVANTSLPTIVFESPADLETKLRTALSPTEVSHLIHLRRLRVLAQSCVKIEQLQGALHCAMLLNNWSFRDIGNSGALIPVIDLQAVLNDTHRVASATVINIATTLRLLSCGFEQRRTSVVNAASVFPRVAYKAQHNLSRLPAAIEFLLLQRQMRPLLADGFEFNEQTIRAWRRHLKKCRMTCPTQDIRRSHELPKDLAVAVSYPLSDNRSPNELPKLLALAGIMSAIETLRKDGHVELLLSPSYHANNRPAAAQEVFRAQLSRVYRADFAVVVLDPAATGVGVSIQQLVDSGVPCFVVALDDEWPRSRLVDGMPLHVVDSIVFRQDNDWQNEFREMIRGGISRLGRAISLRRAVKVELEQYRIDHEIRKYAILRGLEIDQAWEELTSFDLARRSLWYSVRRSPQVYSLLSLLHIACFAQQHNWHVEPLGECGLALRAPVRRLLMEHQIPFACRNVAERSLENLVAVAHEIPGMAATPLLRQTSDCAVLNRVWAHYAAGLVTAARNDQEQGSVGQSTWRQRLREVLEEMSR
jgi:hypothetical protein